MHQSQNLNGQSSGRRKKSLPSIPPRDLEKQFSKIKVLKPHGSINWYKDHNVEDSGNVDQICICVPPADIFRGGTFGGKLRINEFNSRTRSLYKSRFVPPGHKRNDFPFVWDQMAEVFRNAEEIIFIGFSFNSFDGHIFKKIKSLELRNNVTIQIVNPENSIENHYKEIFPAVKVQKIFDGIGQYCLSLKDNEGMDKFSEIFSQLSEGRLSPVE